MSLNLPQREKLVAALQSEYPLAKAWHEIKERTSWAFRSLWDCVGNMAWPLGFGAVLSGVIYVGLLNLNIFAFIVCALVGVILSVATIIASAIWLKSVWETLDKMRISKKFEKHKGKMRDYVKQKNALRQVKRLLPELSESDLNLLHAHPKLNPVFEKYFSQEFKRRKNLQTMEKINCEFLSPSVEVEHHNHNCTPSDASIKTLMCKGDVV